ncbi:MAG: PIN domain-containing protein [Candidatus Binatia bacterium]
MAMTTGLALIDTNVLVHSFYNEQPQYPAAVQLRDSAQEDEAALCMAPQTVAEFYAVVTNPRRVSAPFSPAEALAEIDTLLALPGLALLTVPSDLVQRLTQLPRRRPALGRQVFDLQRVATMLGNGVRRNYSFNTKDFEPFQELDVIVPTLP